MISAFRFFIFLLLVLHQTTYAEKYKEISWYDLMDLDLKALTSEQKATLSEPLKIVGFMVPFVDDGMFESIEEFYLVPDPMMCVHVPPPSPNSMLHIKMQKNIPLNIDFEGVYILGNITQINENAEFGDAGYVLEGENYEECDDYPYDEFLIDDLDEMIEDLINSTPTSSATRLSD